MLQQQMQAQLQQAAGQPQVPVMMPQQQGHAQLSPQEIQEQMMRAQMLYAQLAGTAQAAMHPAVPPGAPIHQGATFAGGAAQQAAVQPQQYEQQSPGPHHAAIQRKGSDLNESFSTVDPNWKPPFAD